MVLAPGTSNFKAVPAYERRVDEQVNTLAN